MNLAPDPVVDKSVNRCAKKILFETGSGSNQTHFVAPLAFSTGYFAAFSPRHTPYLQPMPSQPWPLLLSFLLHHTACLAQPLPADSLVAPNGALHLRLWLDPQGVPTYTVTHGPERVQLVAPSRLGVEANSERSFGLRRGLSRPSFVA